MEIERKPGITLNHNDGVITLQSAGKTVRIEAGKITVTDPTKPALMETLAERLTLGILYAAFTGVSLVLFGIIAGGYHYKGTINASNS